jgi:tyrosyl-tRNA synthetase
MSKSLGNYVGITEPPQEIFGKLMSISDPLMWRYIELLSFAPLEEVRKWRAEVEAGRNPRDIKVLFAKEIVERFHDRAAADAAHAEFEARFRRHELPAELPEVRVPGYEPQLLTQVLKAAGLTASTSESLRMIEQGGVKIDGERVSDKGLKLPPGTTAVLQVGKRKAARVTVG